MPRGSKPGEHRGGRKPGSLNKTTLEIRTLAQKHGPAMIAEAVRIATQSDSDASRMAAINTLLDRGYGKPPQALEHTGKDGGSIDTTLTIEFVKAKAQ